MPSPPEARGDSLEQRRAFNFVGFLVFSVGKELCLEYQESRSFEDTWRPVSTTVPAGVILGPKHNPFLTVSSWLWTKKLYTLISSSAHPRFVPAFPRAVTSHLTCKFEMNTWDLTFNDGWNMLTKLSHNTLCNLSPRETEPNMHIGHDLRKTKQWYFMNCIKNMILISCPLPCAGAVCICPWCHFGGMSLWQHGHSSLWIQIHILQHQQTRSTDQFQPDKRWVSGNFMCLSHCSWCIVGV